MTTREIESLENLRNLCLNLAQRREKNTPWPFTGASGPRPGPTEEEAELLIKAYVLSLPQEIIEAEGLNKINEFSPEYPLVVAKLIEVFLQRYKTKPEDIEESTLVANTLGAAVIPAYEEHLKALERQKKERAVGKRFKPPSLQEQITRLKEIRQEELRQEAFLKEVERQIKTTKERLKPILEDCLRDDSLLPSLTPEQKLELVEELVELMTQSPETKRIQDFLEQKEAAGETIIKLKRKYEERGLPPNESAEVAELLNLTPETGVETFPTRLPEYIKRHLETAYHLHDDEVSPFLNKLEGKKREYEKYVSSVVRLQNLMVLGRNPDTNRLYYPKSFLLSHQHVRGITEKLAPKLTPTEKEIFTANLYAHLYGNFFRRPQTHPALLDQKTFTEDLKKTITDFFQKSPIYKGLDKYRALIPSIGKVLDENQDLVLALKEFAHANYSACASPNQLPDKIQAKVNSQEVSNLRHLIGLPFNTKRDTFFGTLTPFIKTRLVSLGPEGTSIVLEFLANPEEVLKRGKKAQKIIERSGIQNLDPLQRQHAVELLGFLKDHPFLNRILQYPALIQSIPSLTSVVGLILHDPSYFLYIPKIFLIYEGFFTKLYLKQGFYSGLFYLKIPFVDFCIVRPIPFFSKLIEDPERLPRKVWDFLWAKDKYGDHTFLFSNPKRWAIKKIKTFVKENIIKRLESDSLRIAIQRAKKFFYKTLIKVFGKNLGAAIIKKITTSAALKTLGAILGTLLGITTGPIGWVGTAIFVYSLLRDVFPQIKTLEKLLALGVGLLIYSAFSLVGSLFAGIGGLISGGIGALGGMVSSFISGLTTTTVTAPVAAVGAGIGGVAAFTLLNSLMTHSAFVEYQKAYAPIFYSNCYIKDIHKTDVITEENKANFIAKYKALFPNSLLEQKIDEVINKSIAANFNPALAISIWGEESHFSNYGTTGGETNIVEGNDFGCGVKCSSNRPTNFDESLGCFVANRPSCNNQCLSKTNFSEFMECYGPAAENPNFISNVLVFYRQLVPSGPDAIECPGGTTGTFASNLINQLLSCYDNGGIINANSLNDNGECLKNNGIPPASVSHIVSSVSNFSALQCVGFAKAVEAGTGAGVGFTSASFGNAKEYFQELPGYQLIYKNQNNVMVGDLAFFSGEYGHVGVVVETRGEGESSQFRIAQAIGVAPDGSWYGLVNESGWLHISWPSLMGFLRRL